MLHWLAVARSRLQAARQQKRQRPLAVAIEQPACAVPVERACRKELRKQPVLASLVPVAAPAQPAQVVGRERPEHSRRAQRPSDIYRQSVVDLIGALAAHLTECVLYLLGTLAGRDAIGVQAVEVPARPDMRGRLIAPAADAVPGRLSPSGGPVDEPPGMCRRMPSVVQHKAPELALSDGSFHGLPCVIRKLA